ncbi:histone-lysine N-methyltransferase SETDB1-A [Austrofundulus limnaeus]|uniref:Histone-lysine N-methyltransferase SETDB1-A n=1 Tax=Austrofundulus limnaeus TaxID=52670 RepID=A0A2I4D125_AUSLI|nr:PREDICTED: histone-lysine N-methyltransferase SETDB1-A-like [Austrofundulus limnaeus]
MESDEMEMTIAELQSLIRDRVQKTLLSSSALNEKFHRLRSLLCRNQTQISKLSTVCQSVAKCEQTVKELYSLIGWEYEDDSDESNGKPSGCSRARPFLFVTSRRHIHKTSSQSSSSEDEEMQESHEDILNKNAVVVLTKLKQSQIMAALRAPSPQPDSSDEDVLNGSESDMQWEPETHGIDPEFSGSDFEIKPRKRRKMDPSYSRCRTTKKIGRVRRIYRITDSSTSSSESNRGEAASDDDDKTTEATELQENGSKIIIQSEKKTTESVENETAELCKSNSTESGKLESGETKSPESGKIKSTESGESKSTESGESKSTESGESKSTESGESKNTETKERKTMELRKRKTDSDKKQTTESDKQKTTKSTTSKAPQADTTTSSQSNTKTGPQSNASKAATLSTDNKGGAPVDGQSQKTTDTPPKVQHVEITVNMSVLARRRTLSWKPGKVIEIITKGDGKVKYKVIFEEKGKCLVSSHHIAPVTLPLLDNLFVGARVVVKSESDQADFQPGILTEVPNRKNRMRFLVFIDDHTPVYCPLPSLRLVCKPLEDPLDDIPDENHRSYMRGYLKSWPYPPLTQYKVGQMVKVHYNDALEKCEVLEIDCSLIRVVFPCDQQKEWIFRGSMRLEHIININKDMLTKPNGEKNEPS